MDPFKYFPSEISNSILSHLTGKEVLDASVVSKTWYSTIGDSSSAMQKVQLNLFWVDGPLKIDNKMADILINTPRRYQNVVIKFHSFSLDKFHLIMEQECRNWKKVQLKRLTFKSVERLMNFLKTCHNTLEELELDNLYIKHEFGMKVLNFPKLKKLKLTFNKVQNVSINQIFMNCKKLECIIYNDVAKNGINHIKTILKNNHNLKHLELTSQQVDSVFNEDMSYNFKLDTFISCSFNYLPSSSNYKQLLSQHFYSLKTFSVDRIERSETISLIFKMPKLKYLKIGRIDTSAMMFYNQLSVNKSIEELSYCDYDNDFYFMKCLVDAVPNLKKVEMFSLTQNMAENMSSSLKKLEAIKLFTLGATNLSSKDLFANLKHLHINMLSLNVVEHISSIPVDDCNPLVKLIKKSSYFRLN